MKQKVLAFVTVFVLLFGFLAFPSIAAEGEVLPISQDGSCILAENDLFQVTGANQFAEIQIKNKQTGQIVSTSVTDETVDYSTINERWKKKMSSLFALNYTNLKAGFGAVITTELTGADYTAEAVKTNSGALIQYDFPGAGIKIGIEVLLSEDGVRFRVPQESLEEYGEFSLVSMDFFPFFMSASDKRDGYFFYPDGSGAIMEFKDSSHINEKTKYYSVYGDLEDYEGIQGFFDEENAKVLLPVYGSSIDGEAVLAILEEGEECMKISVNPSSNMIGVNYIFPQFVFRRGFDDPRVTTKSMKTYDEGTTKTSFTVYYRFLESGKASYSDMAVSYRDYLIGKGELTKKQNTELPLALDLFVGTKEKGMLFDTMKTVTTFSQAQEILEELQAGGINQIQVGLKGWAKKGYGGEPSGFDVSGKAGGTKELKKLAEYAQKNGITLYLESDFVNAMADTDGYSKRNDVVYLGNQTILTDLMNEQFLLSPLTAQAHFNQFIKKAKGIQLSGLSLAWMGDVLPYNYNNKSLVSASQTKEIWGNIMAEAKENYGSILVGGGNAYVLKYADTVKNIPQEDMGYLFTTKSVPFYQIVVHGSVDYTGMRGNLSSSLEKCKLIWLEYGYLPHFELSYKSAEELMHTDYNELFTSEFSEWKERVFKVYQEMNEVYQVIGNQYIVAHEQLGEQLYCTTYENGAAIYVNYGNNIASVNGISVPAMGYLVVKEGSVK